MRIVRWSETAAKDLRHLDRAEQRRVVAVVQRFAELESGDVKRLQGPLGAEYRLRAGDLRIRFVVVEEELVILRVLPRDKAYR